MIYEIQLKSFYALHRDKNLWGTSHYAMTNYKEYFAEGVQSYFDANMPSSQAPSTR